MAKITVEYVQKVRNMYACGQIGFYEMSKMLNDKGAETEWLNIIDSLPTYNEKVLAFHNETIIFAFISKTNIWYEWNDDNGDSPLNMTHWMPLPNKPV